MFYPGSRYENAETTTVTLVNGRTVVAVKVPLPKTRSPFGLHRRSDDQRLDHLAYHYLKDATTFWKLCEANDTPCPDALAARGLVGIPYKE